MAGFLSFSARNKSPRRASSVEQKKKKSKPEFCFSVGLCRDNARAVERLATGRLFLGDGPKRKAPLNTRMTWWILGEDSRIREPRFSGWTGKTIGRNITLQ